MTIYTLYKKVDKIFGLHYLGMTTQNPYEYPGSGKDWKEHLANNITEVQTTILYQTSDKKEFNEVGRYYSRLYNIVGAMDDFGNKIWANRIPETGGGPGWGKGENNIIHDPQVRTKMIESINSPECFEKRSKNNGMKRPEVVAKVIATHSLPENKKNFSEKMIEVNAREEVKRKKREWATNNNPMNDPVARAAWELRMKDPTIWEKRQENYTPKKHGMYDHVIYEFIHKDGTIERCQRYELEKKYNLSGTKLSLLVRAKINSHKGWRLLVV